MAGKRIYPINESAFASLEREEDAYWFGFLLADGSVGQGKSGCWTLSLILKQSDYEHVEKLHDFLGGPAPTKHPNGCRYELTSKLIVQRLISLGCVPGKSYGHPVPRVPSNSVLHFIRGYFDGDGCISYCHHGEKQNFRGAWYADFTGNEKFLKWIRWRLSIRGIHVSAPKKRKNSIAFRIVLSNYSGLCLLGKKMYENASVFLTRKKERFEEAYACAHPHCERPTA